MACAAPCATSWGASTNTSSPISKQGAHDGGEFFTPPSIVIEPKDGVILDPACGSGGMFVQSSHFIE
jgi:type I restriction-modification system DNA methylase subunit